MHAERTSVGPIAMTYRGDVQIIESGGFSLGATVSGGGQETVSAGGLASGTTLSGGVLSVFGSSLDSNLAALGGSIPHNVLQMIEAQRTLLVGIQIPTGVSSQSHAALQQAINEAFVTSFRVAMLIASGLALASALSALLLIEGKK